MAKYFLVSVLYVLLAVDFGGKTTGASSSGDGQAGRHNSTLAACTENSDCSVGEYCAKTTGDCDGEGTCQLMPTVCPDIWDPVCGCDGNTYSNGCFAAMAGVNVEYEGECMAACTENSDCSAGEYCAKATGDCDGEGTCQVMPTVCPDIWDPVCGCDGNTYSNDCFAAMAGVNVEYEGECMAACTENSDCSAGEYCAKATGDCDGEGTCQVMPTVCPDVWDPVCGCDGNTYSNDCFAAMAGVNVEYEGECQGPIERGDVNGDGNVNVLDVLAVINHILGIHLLDEDALWYADCNDDGEVNVLDALGVVNMILGIDECEP